MKQVLRIKTIKSVSTKGLTPNDAQKLIKALWEDTDFEIGMVGVCKQDSYTIGILDDASDMQIMATPCGNVKTNMEIFDFTKNLGETIEVYNSLTDIDIWKI